MPDDEQQQRLEGQVALAQGPAQGEGAVGVDVGADDGAGPAVLGLACAAASSADAAFQRVAAQVERLGQLRRRRVGEEQEGLHRAQA